MYNAYANTRTYCHISEVLNWSVELPVCFSKRGTIDIRLRYDRAIKYFLQMRSKIETLPVRFGCSSYLPVLSAFGVYVKRAKACDTDSV